MSRANVLRLVAMLLMVLAPGLAMGQDITFTGDVTYRERIALPPGAQLRVTLVSLPGETPIASATAPVAPGGQIPLRFVLDVRSTALRSGDSYGLLAQISAAGRQLFANTIAVPVLAASPMPVTILTRYEPAPASMPEDATPAVAAIALPGTDWTVTSIGGDPVLPGTVVTLAIDTDLRAGGDGGCNRYVTEAQVDGEALSFGPVAGTRMACALDVTTQENRFFAVLGATAKFALEGDTLQLRDAAGVTLAGLVRAATLSK